MKTIKTTIKNRSLLLAPLFCAALPFSAQTAQVEGKETAIHHVESAVCGECHQQIYNQWKDSMHAKSSALEDPIHATFYRKVMGDPTVEGLRKKGKYPVCLQCHAPNAAKDKKTKLDSKNAYREGVNCVSCHTLESYKGIRKPDGKLQLGASAYERSENLQGPRGFLLSYNPQEAAIWNAVNPHLGSENRPANAKTPSGKPLPDLPLTGNSLLQSSKACLGCHDMRPNSNKVVLCNTGDEFLQDGSKETCQSCHMPVSNGIVDHSIGGGHDVAMLERAVRLDLFPTREGNKLKLRVELENKQPHKAPTGAPFRNIVLKLTARDKTGNVLWTNFKKHPMDEDPQAYFVYTLQDAKGNFSTPPKAVGVKSDSRLEAHETRELQYEIDAKNVDSVRAELFYNLLWPQLVKKMTHLPAQDRESKLINWAEKKIQ